VAIKLLHDCDGANSSNAILEEAKIMASIEHPNLLKLLAISMTSRLMLVTQLMPLGKHFYFKDLAFKKVYRVQIMFS
jgi:epidermal growth factor receptor